MEATHMFNMLFEMAPLLHRYGLARLLAFEVEPTRASLQATLVELEARMHAVMVDDKGEAFDMIHHLGWMEHARPDAWACANATGEYVLRRLYVAAEWNVIDGTVKTTVGIPYVKKYKREAIRTLILQRIGAWNVEVFGTYVLIWQGIDTQWDRLPSSPIACPFHVANAYAYTRVMRTIQHMYPVGVPRATTLRMLRHVTLDERIWPVLLQRVHRPRPTHPITVKIGLRLFNDAEAVVREYTTWLDRWLSFTSYRCLSEVDANSQAIFAYITIRLVPTRREASVPALMLTALNRPALLLPTSRGANVCADVLEIIAEYACELAPRRRRVGE